MTASKRHKFALIATRRSINLIPADQMHEETSSTVSYHLTTYIEHFFGMDSKVSCCDFYEITGANIREMASGRMSTSGGCRLHSNTSVSC